MEFRFDGVEVPVTLPNQYLTFEQMEAVMRGLIALGQNRIDTTDPANVRRLVQLLIGPEPELGKLPWTIRNQETIDAMYQHVNRLLNASMAVGDTVIDEVQAKKVKRVKGKQRNSRRSKSK